MYLYLLALKGIRWMCGCGWQVAGAAAAAAGGGGGGRCAAPCVYISRLPVLTCLNSLSCISRLFEITFLFIMVYYLWSFMIIYRLSHAHSLIDYLWTQWPSHLFIIFLSLSLLITVRRSWKHCRLTYPLTHHSLLITHHSRVIILVSSDNYVFFSIYLTLLASVILTATHTHSHTHKLY